jgi:hypothetical protein
MLYYLDDLDAKVNGFQQIMSKSGDDQSNWSEFHKLFERFLFRKAYASIESPMEVSSADENGWTRTVNRYALVFLFPARRFLPLNHGCLV